VWADDQYRAQNLRWQHGFDDELAYANEVLGPMLGLRLEADYRSWDHQAPNSTLAEHLAALREIDDGDDAMLIVGLTSSLTLVSATYELLALAQLGGRYMVLRGHADLEERKEFERAFPDVSVDERGEVLAARRRHKTTTVLLHEVAHCLGAVHEVQPGGIMSTTFTDRAAALDDRNRELMLTSLDDRLKPAAQRDPAGTARALIAALERGWAGWNAPDRAEELTYLHELVDGLPAGGRPRSEAAVVAVLHTPVDPMLGAAASRIAASDVAGARTELAAAEVVLDERAAELPADQATAGWLGVAAMYQAMGALSWAEHAITKSHAAPGHTRGIGTWAQSIRVRYGIPRGGERWKLDPADEAAAVEAVREALAQIDANELAPAAQALAAADERWPKLPGLLAARCDLELHRNALPAATAACDRSLAEGGSSWALYVRGQIELRSRDPIATWAAVSRLRAAIAADPELREAWRALGQALERAKATDQLGTLRAEFQARFHTALTP
jgi:hypothetical protein